jgi:hypothetical protein
MPSQINGDFSDFPQSIRKHISFVAGEVGTLRYNWEVYRDFFMQKREYTELINEFMGEAFEMFQKLLQNEIFLLISKLTDQDRGDNQNLSLWCLDASFEKFTGKERVNNAKAKKDIIIKMAEEIRRHRSKRIVHTDKKASFNLGILNEVKFKTIGEVIKEIENYINIFYKEFERKPMRFDLMDASMPFTQVYDTVTKVKNQNSNK